MLRDLNHGRRSGAALCALATLLAPASAHADNMGGLAYVLIIWPTSLLLVVALVILSLVGRSRLKAAGDGASHRGLGLAMKIASVVAVILSVVITVAVGQAFGARGDFAAFSLSVVPVAGAALLCFLTGRRLRAR